MGSSVQSFVVNRIVEKHDGCVVELLGMDVGSMGRVPPTVRGDIEVHYPDRESVPFEAGESVGVVLEGDGFQVAPEGPTAESRG